MQAIKSSLHSLSRRASRPAHNTLKPMIFRITQKKSFHVSSHNITPLSFESSAYQAQLKGEDSCFMHKHFAFGVADGVGGWGSMEGADPKLYAQSIMKNCEKELDSITPPIADDSVLTAKQLLVDAALPVMESELLGGTTACICLLTQNNMLQIANIGDSRCYVFRTFGGYSPQLYFMTPEQIVAFNAPVQLGPKKLITNTSYLVADPRQWSECFNIPIVPGDVIVAVTDGVSDNLFPRELLSIVAEWIKSGESVEKLSENIVESATKKQMSPDARTPFGSPKPDDTTVVAAKVVESKTFM